MNFLLSPWIGMAGGGVLSVLVAIVVGYPTFRLKGHYFAIATIAVAEIVHVDRSEYRGIGGRSRTRPPDPARHRG